MHHGIDAEEGGAAQDGGEVLRIGDLIED